MFLRFGSTPHLRICVALFVLVVLVAVPGQSRAQLRFQKGVQAGVAFQDDATTQVFALADLNKDGAPDLIASAFNDDDTPVIAVLLNNGDGTYGTPVFHEDPEDDVENVISIKIADIGAPNFGPPDGNLDVIALDLDGGLIIPAFGDGAGGLTFADADSRFVLDDVDAFDGDPVAMAVGDFDGENGPDLAVLGSGIDQGHVLFLCNLGRGTFDGCSTSVLETQGGDPISIVTGNFDGQGGVDVVAVNSLPGDGNIVLFLNSGDGAFERSSGANPGLLKENAKDVAAGRVNDDAIDDLVVVYLETLGGDAVHVLLGSADGRLRSQGIIEGNATSAAAVVIADFNGDGVNDLAIAQSVEGETFLMRGDGGVQFTNSLPSQGSLTGTGIAISAADIDEDGDIDFVVAHRGSSESDVEGFRIAINQQIAPTPTVTPTGPTATPTATAPATATVTPTRVAPPVLEDCAATLPATSAGDGIPNGMVGGDFDADGHTDLAIVAPFDGSSKTQIVVILNRPEEISGVGASCQPSTAESFAVEGVYTSIAAGNVTSVSGGDRLLDLVLTGPAGTATLINQGNGRFSGQPDALVILTRTPESGTPTPTPVTPPPTPNSSRVGVVVGNFVNNNIDDLVVATTNGGTVLLGSGDGVTFVQQVFLPVAGTAFVVVAKLDNDDYDDVAIASNVNRSVVIYLRDPSNPDSLFSSPRVVSLTGGQPKGMVAVDLNSANSRQELLVAVEGSGLDGSFVVIQRNSDDTFAQSTPIPSDTQPRLIGAGKYVGDDNRVDAVLANSFGTVSFFPGMSAGGFSAASVSLGTDIERFPKGLVTGYFDNDSTEDIVTVHDNGTITFLLSSHVPATPTPSRTNTPTVTSTPTETRTAGPSSTPTITNVPTRGPTETPKEGAFTLSSCSLTRDGQHSSAISPLLLLVGAVIVYARRRAERADQ